MTKSEPSACAEAQSQIRLPQISEWQDCILALHQYARNRGCKLQGNRLQPQLISALFYLNIWAEISSYGTRGPSSLKASITCCPTNSIIARRDAYNYSWPLFPYIWSEIKFQIAYQSDLEFVAKTMQKIVEEELGEEMIERVAVYRDLLARTPVDELEVREHPRVIFRVDEVTWVDAIVRYLVAPREAGSTKSRLIPKLVAALNAAPEKVMFPKGDAR